MMDLKTGDVVYSSWGYEQTNIDFYKVSRMTEKTIWFLPIESEVVKNVAFEVDKVIPKPDEVIGDEIRKKRARYIRIDGGLKKYTKPVTQTSYY